MATDKPTPRSLGERVAALIAIAAKNDERVNTLFSSLPDLRTTLKTELDASVRSELSQLFEAGMSDAKGTISAQTTAAVARISFAVNSRCDARFEALRAAEKMSAEQAEGVRVLLAQLQPKFEELSRLAAEQAVALSTTQREEVERIIAAHNFAAVPVQGITLKLAGRYEDGRTYSAGEVVTLNGSSFVAVRDGVTERPSGKSADWQLLAARGSGGPAGADADTSAFLLRANNLSDLANADDARGNLGLGTAATRDVGQAAGNVLKLSAGGQVTVGSAIDGNGVVKLYDGAAGGTLDLSTSDGTFYFGYSVTYGNVGFTLPLAGIGYLFVGENLSSTRSYTLPDESGALPVVAEKSASFTAANHGIYTATATLTVTDPTPVQGAEFTVVVRNGTATVGGTAYSTAGTVIRRIYHSGAWANYSGSVAIGDVTGLGTGVATALGVNIGSAGAPVVLGGALGTPSSGTVTNLTGTASININGTVGATTATTGAFTTVTTSGLVRVGGATSSFPALRNSGTSLQVRLADDSAYAPLNCGNIISGVSGQGSVTCNNSSGGSNLQMTGSVNYGYHASAPVCHSWGNGTTLNGTLDTSLSRVSAGVVGVGSGGAAGDITGTLSCKAIVLSKTITAVGTTGAQTIDKSSGSVNFAAAAASLVVTNSLVGTSSVVQATVATNDATMKSVQVVVAAGSFTIYPNALPTAETKVFFTVTN